ncbi:MAG: hypothetical protein ACYDBH_00590 [Acidobacteriaceae bacterium]
MASTPTSICLCCGRELPLAPNFSGGVSVCHTCQRLDLVSAVQTAHATGMRVALCHGSDQRAARREVDRAQRQLTRRELAAQAKAVEYASRGKRCTECHRRLPVEQFARSADRVDGLQCACRACLRQRLRDRAEGGLPLWRARRDGLRAQSAALEAGAGADEGERIFLRVMLAGMEAADKQ